MTFTNKCNNLVLKTLLTSLFISLTFYFAIAQVQFKLILLEDGETYQVSLIPQKTWAHPYNITSTAQVSLKVLTNSFEVTDLTSLQLDTDWEDNSRNDAPAEAPGMDYISFGLTTIGTVAFNYEAGVELPLFSFKNALSCQGDLTLMDNSEDPFLPPNSRNSNIGNSITIFGARGEAYTGNSENFTVVPCQTDFSTSTESAIDLVKEPRIYPNPAINEIFVELNWEKGKMSSDLIIFDAVGKTVKRQAVSLENGFNKIQLGIKDLSFGIYTIKMQFDGQFVAIERFVKGDLR